MKRNTEKSERLLEAVGKIDEELIADAARGPEGGRRRLHIFAGIAAAACLALLVFAGVRLFSKDEPDSQEPLPMLTLGEASDGTMGFEGYLAYDSSELVNANPWREDMELPVLPVYENPLTYDENYFVVSGEDREAMEKLLLETADRLGLEREKLKLGDNAPDEETRRRILEKEPEMEEAYFEPTALTAEAKGVRIEVDRQLTAHITLDIKEALSDQYSFNYDSSYEELAAAAEYLREKYRELLHMEQPQINISGGDYHYDGLQSYYDLSFFEMAGSGVDQILHYNFNQVEFYVSEEEGTLNIRIFQPELGKKAGDYPIISVEEAKELLLKGAYTTSVPYEMPGEAYIAKAELVYRHEMYDPYYIPYYRFYVEVSGQEEGRLENGLKDYGAYYVPAVEGSYISDMPVWDGHFN